MQKNVQKLMILEGNIGAGKSTMLSLLSKLSSVSIIPEPTDRWQRINEHENLLNLFYKDTPRWAYTFQSYAFLTRLQAILDYQAQDHSNSTHVLERSVYCDRFCFAKNCYEMGAMSSLEWHIYKEWFFWLVESYAPAPSAFIYLRTDPEVAYQRLMLRNRPEEGGIQLSYLQSLHNKHEDWLMHKMEVFDSLRDIPVLVLDCNQDFEHDVAEQQKHLSKIQDLIATLYKKPSTATIQRSTAQW